MFPPLSTKYQGVVKELKTTQYEPLLWLLNGVILNTTLFSRLASWSVFMLVLYFVWSEVHPKSPNYFEGVK